MRKWLPLVFIAAITAFSIAVFSRLPQRMAIHWGMSGQPDGYGSRWFGAFMLPVVTLALWGLMRALPKLDPRSANIEKFRESYEILVIAVVGVMGVLHVGVVGVALGWPISVGTLTPVAIGALFIVLGNLLPRFRSNFFFGIRTPWTLSSETVWARTHRVGGYAMVMVGVLLIAAGLVATRIWLVASIGGSMILVLLLLVYSYVIWRSEQNSK
jgi:uncharacterized membrane protein